MREFTLGPITRLAVGILPLLAACAPPGPEPTMISLVEQFGNARVENRGDPGEPHQRHEWRFDGEGTIVTVSFPPCRTLPLSPGSPLAESELAG